jgi:hypothetical protein
MERGKKYRADNKDKYYARKRVYYELNKDKIHKRQQAYRRACGMKPMSESKECGLFLGVHIAEGMLSKLFKDVKRMPHGNKGYDFICSNGYKIDVKSACRRKHGDWAFHIDRNTTADYFLCIMYDNRTDLNPLHLWLIPGEVVNHLITTGVSESTVGKWSEYEIEINKSTKCCDSMRH